MTIGCICSIYQQQQKQRLATEQPLPGQAGTGRQPSTVRGSTDRPFQYKSLDGFARPAKLGRTPCRANSLRPSTSVGVKKVRWVIPGEAWRGPRDQMVYVLIREQAVQHHDEGVQARHLQTECIHLLSLG